LVQQKISSLSALVSSQVSWRESSQHGEKRMGQRLPVWPTPVGEWVVEQFRSSASQSKLCLNPMLTSSCLEKALTLAEPWKTTLLTQWMWSLSHLETLTIVT
jgi:hypothetical protein